MKTILEVVVNWLLLRTPSRGTRVLLMMAMFVLGMGLAAQGAAEEVVLPDVGVVEIQDLPPELAGNIRLPGEVYPEPVDENVDVVPHEELLRPSYPQSNSQEDVESLPTLPSDAISSVSEDSEDTDSEQSEELSRSRQRDELEKIRHIQEEMPANAYVNALDHLLQMQTVSAPEEEGVGTPWSFLMKPAQFFTRAPAAWAQGGSTCSTSWTAIGPASFEIFDSLDRNAGIVKATAISSGGNPLYVGARDMGLWKSSNSGQNWLPKTDNLSLQAGTPTPSPNKTSLQIEVIAINPADQTIVLAGTGRHTSRIDFDRTPLLKGIGVLRSVDSGEHWEQIGPAWCDLNEQPSCGFGGTCLASQGSFCASTDPTKSNFSIKQITIDPSGKVWVATSMGLWSSLNALNRSVSAQDVSWGRVTSSFWTSGATPDPVTHVLLSPSNSQDLYASVATSTTLSHNGWYKFTGGSWVKLPNPTGFPSGADPGPAVMAPGTPDTLWSLMQPFPGEGIDTTCTLIDGSGKRERIFAGTSTGSSITWQLINATRTCVTSSDCCDGGGNACRCFNTSAPTPTPVTTCPQGSVCKCDPDPDCGGSLSLGIDPTDRDVVAIGNILLYKSVKLQGGGIAGFKLVTGSYHPDVNDLTFRQHDDLYVGTDGGLFHATSFSTSPSVTSLNGDLANVEFYGGSADQQAVGLSAGGTQDNGGMRGGFGRNWTRLFGGDGGTLLIDPRNSNVIYQLYGGGAPCASSVCKSYDGGYFTPKIDNLPATVQTLSMSPIDSQTLLVYGGGRIYRTTTGAEAPLPGVHAWNPISQDLPSLGAGPVNAFAFGDATNLIFAGTDSTGVWKTTDAVTFQRVDNQTPPGCSQPDPRLPGKPISDLTIDRSQACTSTSCTLYTTIYHFSGTPPGHVFRSQDAGVTWTDISGGCDPCHPCAVGTCVMNATGTGVCTGGLPDVPVNKIVIHPTCHNIVYVGTDMGIYQGTFNDGTCATTNTGNWSWCPFGTGFPITALVKDLSVVPEAGLLRAFTFGRSIWDAPAFPIPNADVRVNQSAPSTGVGIQSPQIATNVQGTLTGLAYVADPLGANNTHVYFRGYTYDGSGNPAPAPTPSGAGDFRVDDSSSHTVGRVAAAGSPTATGLPFCAWMAWTDSRGGGHIFYQKGCSDQTKLFVSDMQADDGAAGITDDPSIGWSLSGSNFAVAWDAARTPGGARDVYMRLFSSMGAAIGTSFKVNSASAVDARVPAVAASADQVFVAWQEPNSPPLIRKYNLQGTPVGTPVPVSTPIPGSSGGVDVDIALDNQSPPRVVVVWTESFGGVPKVYRRRLANNLSYLSGESPAVVANPPALPSGSYFSSLPAVAIAPPPNNDYVVTWVGNAMKGSSSDFPLNVYGKTFSSSNLVIKRDFHVELGNLTGLAQYAVDPRAARVRLECLGGTNVGGVCTSDPNCPGSTCSWRRFAFGWNDNRSGKYEIYLRSPKGR